MWRIEHFIRRIWSPFKIYVATSALHYQLFIKGKINIFTPNFCFWNCTLRVLRKERHDIIQIWGLNYLAASERWSKNIPRFSRRKFLEIDFIITDDLGVSGIIIARATCHASFMSSCDFVRVENYLYYDNHFGITSNDLYHEKCYAGKSIQHWILGIRVVSEIMSGFWTMNSVGKLKF